MTEQFDDIIREWSPDTKNEKIQKMYEISRNNNFKNKLSGDITVSFHRDTIEFIESLLIRIIADLEDNSISDRIINYRPVEIEDFCSGIITAQKTYISSNYSKDYISWIEKTFIPDAINGVSREQMVDDIIDSIYEVCKFYKNYYSVYNASKHGMRYSILRSDRVNLEYNNVDDISKEEWYIVYATKDNRNEVIIPVEYISKYSYIISNKTLTLIKLLNGCKNKYFKYHSSKRQTIKNYTHIPTTDSHIIIKRDLNLDYNKNSVLFDMKIEEPYITLIVNKEKGFIKQDITLNNKVSRLSEYGIKVQDTEIVISNLDLQSYTELWRLYKNKDNINDVRYKYENEIGGKTIGDLRLDLDSLFDDNIREIKKNHINFLKAYNGITGNNIHPYMFDSEELISFINQVPENGTDSLSSEDIVNIMENIF